MTDKLKSVLGKSDAVSGLKAALDFGKPQTSTSASVAHSQTQNPAQAQTPDFDAMARETSARLRSKARMGLAQLKLATGQSLPEAARDTAVTGIAAPAHGIGGIAMQRDSVIER